MPIMIRSIEPDDVPAVLEIESRHTQGRWSAALFERCFTSFYRGWVALSEEKVVGYVIMTLVADQAELLNIAVAPRCRRQGVGKLLLEHGEQTLSSGTSIFLEVRASNQPAILLYESLGYCEMGVRHNYYPAYDASGRETGQEDALLYAKECY